MLEGLTQDSSGGSSSMRVTMLYISFSVITLWFFVNVIGVIGAFKNKTDFNIKTIPVEVVGLVAGVCGIKVYQRKIEESTPQPPKTP